MIIDKLSKNKKIPMHMPGHKRNTSLAPYLKRLGADLDITEISGFDNLHDPCGIILNSMQKAAKLRNAKAAFYLVNGSTAGILAGICSVVSSADTVICARNCHKSVYNALEISGAKTVFVMPKIHSETGISGSIMPSDIENAIRKNPNAKLVILTSPTYEGVLSDIKEICKVSHKFGIPVLVDSAHGAHLGFSKVFPADAISLGADISVESLHKTLPSLTQTAVLYANGDLINCEKIKSKLSVFQSSSPSYLLLASIDSCVNLLFKKGKKLFDSWDKHLSYFYKKAEGLKNLKLLKNNGEFFGLDKSKIVILTKNGFRLNSELCKMGIECEMTSAEYVVAMTGMGDTKKTLSYFAACLLKIDKKSEKYENSKKRIIKLPEKALEIKDTEAKESEWVSVDESVGKISADYVFAYPPGIPIICPGEIISEEIKNTLLNYICEDNSIIKNLSNKKIKVCRDCEIGT